MATQSKASAVAPVTFTALSLARQHQLLDDEDTNVVSFDDGNNGGDEITDNNATLAMDHESDGKQQQRDSTAQAIHAYAAAVASHNGADDCPPLPARLCESSSATNYSLADFKLSLDDIDADRFAKVWTLAAGNEHEAVRLTYRVLKRLYRRRFNINTYHWCTKAWFECVLSLIFDPKETSTIDEIIAQLKPSIRQPYMSSSDDDDDDESFVPTKRRREPTFEEMISSKLDSIEAKACNLAPRLLDKLINKVKRFADLSPVFRHYASVEFAQFSRMEASLLKLGIDQLAASVPVKRIRFTVPIVVRVMKTKGGNANREFDVFRAWEDDDELLQRQLCKSLGFDPDQYRSLFFPTTIGQCITRNTAYECVEDKGVPVPCGPLRKLQDVKSDLGLLFATLTDVLVEVEPEGDKTKRFVRAYPSNCFFFGWALEARKLTLGDD